MYKVIFLIPTEGKIIKLQYYIKQNEIPDICDLIELSYKTGRQTTASFEDNPSIHHFIDEVLTNDFTVTQIKKRYIAEPDGTGAELAHIVELELA